MEDIKIIEAKKEAIFSRMTSLYELSKKVSSQETRNQEDFLSQTSNLESLYNQFNKIIDDYNQCSLTEDEKFVPSYQAWAAFEDLYSRVQHIRSNVLESRKARSPASDASTSLDKKQQPHVSIKLPPIELPWFDGKFENWPLFYNSFMINIHKNSTLNNAQRVQYLVGRLRGQALAVISGTIPNEENYPSIWNSLVAKYQDIFDSKCANNTASNLNEFVERFASSIAAIDQLGITDLKDFIFMHIALKKIDNQVVQGFEMSVRTKDIPTCSDLIEYLRHQVKVMERTNTASQNITQSRISSAQWFNSQPRNKIKPISHTFATTSSNERKLCALCHRTDHDRVYECSKFKNLSVTSRFDFVKTNKYCTNCLSSTHTHSQCNSTSRCKYCNQKHHSLIHFNLRNVNASHQRASIAASRQAEAACASPTTNSSNSSAPAPHQLPAAREEQTSPQAVASVTALTTHNTSRSAKPLNKKINTTILLSTAQVYAYSSRNKKPMLIRCLVDSASQHNLISLQCCKKLNLRISPLHNSVIKTVGSLSTPIIGYVSLTIKSRVSDDTYNINLIVAERLTEQLPTTYVDKSVLDHLIDLPMTDESWNVPGEIEALLGAQLFPYLLLGSRKISSSSSALAPPAIETTLGCIVMGELPTSKPFDAAWSFGPLFSNNELNEQLNKFWNLEELPTQSLASPEDIQCENLYSSSVKRDDNGRYTVALPFNQDPSMLGNSYVSSMRRFITLERKLKANPELRQAYNSVIIDYLEKGYLTEITGEENSINNGYFIPHQAVIRPDKSTTKCRIVLDASAKTDAGHSLNDLLFTGPNLQADLFTLLLNFRLFPIAITADIQQMYLRIFLTEEHRKYQKIIFRFNDCEAFRVFQFNTVTFGLRPSPFLAIRTVKQLAMDERERFPLAFKTASRELYMDDLTSSVMTVEEGISLSEQLIKLFKSGGFSLLKWSSNSQRLLESFPESHRAAVEFSDGNNLKILGINWLPVPDNFGFTISQTDEACTKRVILSSIARLFDVLGLVAPVILYAKLLMKNYGSLTWVGMIFRHKQ